MFLVMSAMVPDGKIERKRVGEFTADPRDQACSLPSFGAVVPQK
jgi:hypothetical protein